MARTVLRAVVFAVGVAFLIGAALSLVFGASPAAFPLTVWGVLIIVGVAFERWRYKATLTSAGSGFEATPERFVDPGTGQAVQVFVNPASGERRYVSAETPAP